MVSSKLGNGIVLKDDLYKNNTLLLKKGCLLDEHLLNKLNKFGVSVPQNYLKKTKVSAGFANLLAQKEVLIIQKDNFKSHKTREVLMHAGFSSENIIILEGVDDFYGNNLSENLAYIFIDYQEFSDDFLEEILLSKNINKLKIFVLDCESALSKNFVYNNEFQDIKFLHQPLAKNYIKALLQLYS